MALIIILVKDQYGNYVLQHCMEAPHGKSQTKCADHVLQLFNDLLFHKHGSNVLEKVNKYHMRCLTKVHLGP